VEFINGYFKKSTNGRTGFHSPTIPDTRDIKKMAYFKAIYLDCSTKNVELLDGF
jgi:hypothetical protein